MKWLTLKILRVINSKMPVNNVVLGDDAVSCFESSSYRMMAFRSQFNVSFIDLSILIRLVENGDEGCHLW